ncbi:MAG: DoxX family membrane protein [Thermomicrobiales bacterium]
MHQIMTRQRTWRVTAVAAAIYVALGIVFGEAFFTGPFWDGSAIFASSSVHTLGLLAIIVCGWMQVRRVPEQGVRMRAPLDTAARRGSHVFDDPMSWKLLQNSPSYALLWLPLRLFVGLAWLASGESKLRGTGWMDGGSALQGFWQNAVAVPESGRPAITFGWYRSFLQFLLDHESYTWFAKAIAVGEFMVGLGLVLGAFTGIAAFFGATLNFNFQLAGSASTNPVLFALAVAMILGWKVAGFWGLDRMLMRHVGTPWTTPAAGVMPTPSTPPRIAAPAPYGHHPAMSSPISVRYRP